MAPAIAAHNISTANAVAAVSAPLTTPTMMLGTGSVDLWLRTSVPDVDLEVTVSEVRSDGKEVYVQSGWLRASARALDTKRSTELLPVPTYTKADVASLPRNKATYVRVPIFPFGHEFAAGSRVRIVVQPPGGNRPSWAFDALQYKSAPTVEVMRTKANASRVVLPVIPAITLPRTTIGPAVYSKPCALSAIFVSHTSLPVLALIATIWASLVVP